MIKKGVLLFSTLIVTMVGLAQVQCSFDNNQGDPNQGFLLFFEDVTAYIYVDPTLDGSAGNPGCEATGGYVLTSLEFPIADAGWFDNPNPANGTGTFEFGVFALNDPSNPCAGVGDNIWTSPVFTKTVQDTDDLTEYFIPTGGIPLDEPFFVTWKILSWNGSSNQVICPVWDGIARPACRQFYSANDGVTFVPHEDFFNSSFGWIDLKVNGFYEVDEFAEVQFIHASGDAAAETVDIRVNGEFPDPSFDDLDFLCSTTSIIVPAGTNEITINPANSTDASNPIATITDDFLDEDQLIGVVHGIASASGYSPGSGVVPLDISYINPAQSSAQTSGETDLVFFHAVTDVSQIDVEIIGGPSIVSGVDYGDASTYVGIDTDTEEIFLSETGLGELQNYILPLDDLELENLASVVIVAGFDNIAANSNGSPLGLYISSPEGGCLDTLDFINSTDENSFMEVDLYPNPVKDFVIFDNNALLDLSRVQIYDVLGNLVSEVDVNDSRNKLDLSYLTSGFYTLTFADNSGNILGLSKIIKSK